ncbi:hypothetical protein B0H10DRAFT_1881698, partial [Mycena sp. CBHHK59/15]
RARRPVLRREPRHRAPRAVASCTRGVPAPVRSGAFLVRAEHGHAYDHHGAHGQLLRRVPAITFPPRSRKCTDSPTTGHLGGPTHDPSVSPLLAPAHVQVCGLDPLRDEVLLYARLLRVPHAFHVGFPSIKAAERWEADFRAGVVASGGRESRFGCRGLNDSVVVLVFA